MRLPIRLIALSGAAMSLVACASLKVKHEVQTIHVKHDVTIGVDKALEDFFAFQEQQALRAGATTAPAATTSSSTNAGVVQ